MTGDDLTGSTTADGATTTLGGLAARGLRQGDLPGGWEPVEQSASPLCPDGDPTGRVRPSAEHEVAFSKEGTTEVLSATVAEFGDEARAEAFLDAVDRGFDACETVDLEGGSYELDPGDGPDLGDDSRGAQITAETAVGEIDGRLAYVRVGRRVATVYSVAIDGEVDEDVAEQALEAVVGRL